MFRLSTLCSIAFMIRDRTRAYTFSVCGEVFSFVDIEVAPTALVFRGHAGLPSVAVPLFVLASDSLYLRTPGTIPQYSKSFWVATGMFRILDARQPTESTIGLHVKTAW
jgi:hypothetical protein